MARNSTVNGVAKYSRSKMYSRRAQHKRAKPVTKVEAKKAAFVTTKKVGGEKNGGERKVSCKPAQEFIGQGADLTDMCIESLPSVPLA